MTSLSDVAAGRPAEPALFASLIDDAAVFPPGNAPLPQAVRAHRAHRLSWYAGLLGPLLVPAASVAELAGLVGPTAPPVPTVGAEPLRVALVARPGTPLATVTDAVHRHGHRAGVEVVGIEVGWSPEWRDLDVEDLPVVLEVPRGADQPRALADIAAEADGGDAGQVRAKFRTGAAPAWDWPTEEELAGFLRRAVDLGLGFKLTGGLHHLVRAEHAGQSQHGLLNIVATVSRALEGASAEQLAAVLAQRDPRPLVAHATGLDTAAATAVRRSFTGYGCCGVTDPVAELRDAGLLEEPA